MDNDENGPEKIVDTSENNSEQESEEELNIQEAAINIFNSLFLEKFE